MPFALAALIVIGAAWGFRALTAPAQIVDYESAQRVAPGFIIPAEVDRLIAAYERRITETTNASDYQILGTLYLEKARLTGDPSRYLAAEAAFERAKELFPSDPAARIGLASALYSLHRFDAAYEEAELVHRAVGRLDALATMADAALALGEYELAEQHLSALDQSAGDTAPILVRKAEWARLDGRGEEAIDLAGAAVEATAASGNPRQRSWYRTFAAQMAFYLGRYEVGMDLIAEALEDDPGSLTAQVTNGRLLAATGDYAAAIETYKTVTETSPDPTFLAELVDLYVLTGDSDSAEDARTTIEVAATLAEADQVYDRAFALYLADHGEDTERAVEIARGELERRSDVGAWDALAWTLLADGQVQQAAEAVDEALALGTLDARFLYHAGMVAAAAGDETRAKMLLEESLSLSPGFQPVQAVRARETLGSLP